MALEDVIREQDDLAAHLLTFPLWPRRWQGYNHPLALQWELHRLIGNEKPAIPREPGVYSLLIQPDIATHPACSYLIYVGKTDSLRRRFGEYLQKERREGGRPKIFRALYKYSDYAWFCYARVPSDNLREVEDALISAYLPPLISDYPADIRSVVGAF